MLKIIGNHISPFVRKVLAVCEIKGLPYEVDSIVPFFGNERFGELSPLRRIPVLVDGAIVINDSSVICEYLEEKWPNAPALPGEPHTRAEARFLDEYADTRLADVVPWKVFGRAVVAPAVFGVERDTAAIDRTMAEELPGVMDLLERWAPASGFKFGDMPGLAVLNGIGDRFLSDAVKVSGHRIVSDQDGIAAAELARELVQLPGPHRQLPRAAMSPLASGRTG